MQLGFVSAILPDQDFETVIDFAAEHDYAFVEVMCWPKGKAERRYAGVTHIDVADLSEDRIAHLHSYLQERKVGISGLGYYPNPMDADAEKAQVYLDHLKTLIQGAKRLGIGTVNTFIGREQHKSVEENLDKFAEVWPPIIQYAEDHGIRIGIENCPMYFTLDEWPEGKNLAYSPAIWRQMFEIVPSPNFGLNYDPSHLLWMQMDYIKPIYEFADRLVHVHVKDAKVYPDKLNEVGILAHPLQFHSPKLPGLGDIDWGAFFSALHDVRYKGPVCVEVEDKAFEGSLEGRQQALVQSRNYLKQFI
ncbi:MAG: sugar phosphate isomerase/epimerase family protein [Bacteroidota bacterium]